MYTIRTNTHIILTSQLNVLPGYFGQNTRLNTVLLPQTCRWGTKSDKLYVPPTPSTREKKDSGWDTCRGPEFPRRIQKGVREETSPVGSCVKQVVHNPRSEVRQSTTIETQKSHVYTDLTVTLVD